MGGQMTWQWGKCEYRATFERSLLSRTTYCIVERRDGDMWVRVASARTTCSHEDQFVKETGRKIALTRALAAASALEVPLRGFADGQDAPEGYDNRKEFRRRAWEAYLWRKGQRVLDLMDAPIRARIVGRVVGQVISKAPNIEHEGFCPECGDPNPCEMRTGCAGEAERGAC